MFYLICFILITVVILLITSCQIDIIYGGQNSIKKDNTMEIKAFTDIHWVKNTKNFDCKCGPYYKYINKYLRQFNIKNVPYDPYVLPIYINEYALKLVKKQIFDTATSMSVLNVINDKSSRIDHIKLIKSALKKNGIAYFKIYTGDKNANKFYQNNLKLEHYFLEIKEVFEKAKIFEEKNLIIAYI